MATEDRRSGGQDRRRRVGDRRLPVRLRGHDPRLNSGCFLAIVVLALLAVFAAVYLWGLSRQAF